MVLAKDSKELQELKPIHINLVLALSCKFVVIHILQLCEMIFDGIVNTIRSTERFSSMQAMGSHLEMLVQAVGFKECNNSHSIYVKYNLLVRNYNKHTRCNKHNSHTVKRKVEGVISNNVYKQTTQIYILKYYFGF